MEIGLFEEIKAVIKSLILSSPQQICIDRLNKDFKETEGYPIPYGKLGFNSLETFLRSIDDTVKVEGKGCLATLRLVGNRKTAHIQEMVRTQKKGKRRSKAPRSNSISQFQGQHRFYTAPRNIPKREQQGWNRPRFNENSFQRGSPHITFANNRSSQQKQNYHEEKTATLLIAANKNYDAIPAELIEDKISDMAEAFEDAVRIKSTKTIETSVSALKVDKPDKTSNKNTNIYMEFMPNSLCAKNKAYSSLNALCEVNCSPDEKSSKHSMHNEENEYTINVTKKLSSSTYTKSILKNKQNGHTLNEEQELVPDSAKKLTSLMQQQCEISNHKKSDELQKAPESDFFQTSFSCQDKYDDMNEAVPKFAANNLVYRVDFPNNTVKFGQKIMPYKLPDDLEKHSIIGIFISEIHNPFKFWFHIHKENHELDLLMHHIERFYMSLDSDELIIPETCHTPGQICAALYNDLWHRGEIIAQPINKKTKVFFLDYGTVSEVNCEHIKYLAMKFAIVPSQAIRGSLSHIRPRGLHWSYEATKHFLSLVCEMMLYAKVTDVDKQNRVLHMVICNTNGPEAIQVNKNLVENGFALYYEEWMEQRIAKNGLRCHHPREDFPTFEMLETGEYPTLSEVLYLEEIGIDYEKIIDGKIFNFGKLNNHENAPEALRNLPFDLINTNPFKCDIIFELYRSTKLI